MIVTHHYVLVLALCRLAVDVRAAPAAPTISQTTDKDGVHVGAGSNVPKQVKDAMNMVSLILHVHVQLSASRDVPLPFCAHLCRHHTRG